MLDKGMQITDNIRICQGDGDAKLDEWMLEFKYEWFVSHRLRMS